MYLLDTNVVSQTSKPIPHPDALRFLRSISAQYLYLSVITMEELRVGIEVLPPGPKRTGLQDWYDTKIVASYDTRLLDVTRAVAELVRRRSRLSAEQGEPVACRCTDCGNRQRAWHECCDVESQRL